MTFLALGYLRTDVSQLRRQWDEAQIRRLARRLGYTLGTTVTLGDPPGDPTRQLMNVVTAVGADAVAVPSADHFESGAIPAGLVAVTDVITVAPEHTYARWATGELPQAGGM
ncbi:hypothetical protein [Nocardia wallacei]|uniref:hypothetical protein n=1 Tax=Nocardia wallacei TaxID=480035 RepID=UPI00245573A4|nr:hypothetical protein [Nocardia wallacei]